MRRRDSRTCHFKYPTPYLSMPFELSDCKVLSNNGTANFERWNKYFQELNAKLWNMGCILDSTWTFAVINMIFFHILFLHHKACLHTQQFQHPLVNSTPLHSLGWVSVTHFNMNL